jgi:signal transduction histidine kinase
MNKKALYSFFIGFILLVVVTIINQWSFKSMKDYTAAVDHSREVINSLERLSNHFKSAQIYSPQHEQAYDKFFYLYKVEAEGLDREVARLKRLVQYNPEQRNRVDSIGHWISQQTEPLLKKGLSGMIADKEDWRLKQLFVIHMAINEGVVYELNLLADREIELRELTRLTSILTLVFTIIAIGLIAGTFITNLLLARKRNWLEGFLGSVLNTTQNGVASFKAIREGDTISDFEVEYANHAIKKFLGAEPDKLVGRRMSAMDGFVQEYQLMDRFKQVVEKGEIQELEVWYKENNRNCWFYVLLARRDDGITVTFHDISDLKRYEGELKKKIEELEHSNTELEQYAYAASHDLQEPLRKIQIFSNYLEETQRDRLDESGKVHLTRIVNAAARMSSLIKDILTFSSIRQEDPFVETDLKGIVQKALRDLDLLIAQKGAKVELEHLPTIEAVPVQMTQLFYNLINNALKFGHPEREPVLQVSAVKLSAEAVAAHKELNPLLSYYEIRCSDNGIGFDQKVADQMFGLFKRLGDRHEYPGSGIGLALCKKVVVNHQGFIVAEGKQGEGATFRMFLPERQSPVTEASS